MQQQPVNTSSGKLILLIKSAYWMALLIIAAMAMASFMLLQQMMAAQQRDEALLSLASTQKALSQRVVFLANAVRRCRATEQPALVASLRKATAEFETNYDLLLERTGADPTVAGAPRSATRSKACFSPSPIISTISRLGSPPMAGASSRRSKPSSASAVGAGYLAGKERAQLDETVANATLDGYTALGERIDAFANARLDSMLDLHRTLFYATIGIIILVALFIFRPMSDVILRKTARAGRRAQFDGLHRRA